MGFHLIIRREGSLLSKVLDQPITETQLEAIRIVIDDQKMAFNVVEDKKNRELARKRYPLYADLFDPYDPDTAPRGGIEQYQAEDR